MFFGVLGSIRNSVFWNLVIHQFINTTHNLHSPDSSYFQTPNLKDLEKPQLFKSL